MACSFKSASRRTLKELAPLLSAMPLLDNAYIIVRRQNALKLAQEGLGTQLGIKVGDGFR
jgi:hypothetical protein